jgi:homocysteine S-methyltransferase
MRRPSRCCTGRSRSRGTRARASTRGTRASRGPCCVAASVGPFGATRHDGSEYRGDYGLDEDALHAFHGPRIAALLGAAPDLLACETIPSLLEARAIVRVLRAHPEARAWVSFSCRDDAHTSAGDPIAACARMLDAEPQVVAIGDQLRGPGVRSRGSCARSRPALRSRSSSIRTRARCGTPRGRCWEGSATPFAARVDDWLAAGASWVGGCCRTTPEDIRRVRAVVQRREG